jgi:hypothetical protein
LGLEKPNSGRDRGETFFPNSGSNLDSDETFQISRNVCLDIDKIVCLLDSHPWDEATGAREPKAQRRKNRVDARRSSVSCSSLQNDGNGDAGRLWFKGRVETLEDDRNREVGPN